MEIMKEIINYIINFEIPFGSATYKPVYFIYASCAMSLLAYLISKERKD